MRHRRKSYGYIIHCLGCLTDIRLGVKDLGTVSDHSTVVMPRFDTEDEAYWAGVADAMWRDAMELQEFEMSVVQTYEYEFSS